MDIPKIKNDLISIIKLNKIQAEILLLIILDGKMTAEEIAKKLGISFETSSSVAKQLIDLGGLIELSENKFESMHPRFIAVNMFRKLCERENIEFKRNVAVDNIGVALEKPYEDARTKYTKK
jgi:predicted transcriptional regulator